MRKKLLSLLTAVLIVMQAAAYPAFAGYENFTTGSTYDGRFEDVHEGDWFAQNVKTSYEYGLINGISETSFAPDRTLTVAEAVKLAASLHSIYHTGAAEFTSVTPWYAPYADYALANGILTAPRTDYDAPATRAVFAALLAASLPADALQEINTVVDGAIRDVPEDAAYAEGVYLLYRAGVLTGSDAAGRFMPESSIRRSEAAAIVTRMAVPSLRQRVTLAERPLTQEELRAKCAPAVFKLYTYAASGAQLGTGSGVLISADGDAVTCGHVINGVSSVVAELADGSRYEVSVCDMDTAVDLAYIHLDGNDLPYLCTQSSAQNGDTVYTLGYPGGGAATMTAGTLLNARFAFEGNTMLQSSTQIAPGSSGGALISESGCLLGVTALGDSDCAYSIPTEQIARMDTDTRWSMAEYSERHKPSTSASYAGYYPVPDFGITTGAERISVERNVEGYKLPNIVHTYRMPAGVSVERVMLQYKRALSAHTYYFFNQSAYTSSAGHPYALRLEGRADEQGAQLVRVVIEPNTSQTIGGLVQTADFFALCGRNSRHRGGYDFTKHAANAIFPPKTERNIAEKPE